MLLLLFLPLFSFAGHLLSFTSMGEVYGKVSYSQSQKTVNTWAHLFEGRLALNPGLNLTRVSFSYVQKLFLGQLSLLFLELPIINL